MKLKPFLNFFRKRKKKESINLEYLIIYQDSGQPIYSKCFGYICGMLGKKDELLTAFLSAVASMPSMFVADGKKVHSMSIGPIKLIFRYTKTEEIICAAFKEENVNGNTMDLIDNLFNGIVKLLEEKHYKTDWTRLTDPKVLSFQKELHQQIIYPWFHNTSSGNEDVHEEFCSLCIATISKQDRVLPIWKRIKNIYSSKPKSMEELKTDFGSIKIGDPAPDFIVQTDGSTTIRLSNYHNEKLILLFFYPKANTPVCSNVAESFRDNYNELMNLEVEVIGISVDTPKDLVAFRAKNNLPFLLVSDTSKDISAKYGCLRNSGISKRITFLIDKKGIIRRIWKLSGFYRESELLQHNQEIKDLVKKLIIN